MLFFGWGFFVRRGLLLRRGPGRGSSRGAVLRLLRLRRGVVPGRLRGLGMRERLLLRRLLLGGQLRGARLGLPSLASGRRLPAPVLPRPRLLGLANELVRLVLRHLAPTHHVLHKIARALDGEGDRKSTRLNSSHGYIF